VDHLGAAVSTNLGPVPDKRPSTADRRWALVAIVVVVVLLAAGVGVYAILPTGTSSPTSSPGDLSPYAQLFAQVGPNGEVTKEMALEAFSLAIAPLPGVTVPSGPAPSVSEQKDGTFAVDWLMPYYDELTSDQQKAVDAALARAPDATKRPATTGNGQIRFELAKVDDTTKAEYVSVLEDAEKKEAQQLNGGGSLGMDWWLSFNSVDIGPYGALAYSVDDQRLKPPEVGCDIHINPYLLDISQAYPWLVPVTLAHEMFHCFEYAHLAGKVHPPAWIVEGLAQWAGEAVDGPSPDGAIEWDLYLVSPTMPLYMRSYDAEGFYLHMAEQGIDPWSRAYGIMDAWEAGGNDDAFKDAGANQDDFLDTWSSGLFRDSSIGDDWDAQGYSASLIAAAQAIAPKATFAAPRIDLNVASGDTRNVSAAKVTNQLINLIPSADIIVVLIDGHARLHTGNVDDIGLQTRTYCTREDSCKCPPGSTWTGPGQVEYMPKGAISDLALTGGLDGVKGQIIGADVSQFCTHPQLLSNNGNSNGDPHLRTINRYKYDFQGAGEFTLLRNADDSIDIQARQEPYPGSSAFVGVSTNTAIAARDNGHKVSVYATGSGLTLHVDGQQVDPASGPDLGAGAAIKPVSRGIEIDFPDGSALTTLSIGRWGINAIVQASPDLLAHGIGLLGPITPGYMGVPALPDGTQLPAAPDTETRDKILYSTFADAWRVTDATTLFDYDPGKSTATYTDKSFPSDTDRHALEAALASPDPDQQAAAQSACAGLTDADLQTDCEYDVFATGDAGFAQSYGAVQDLYDSGISGPTPVPQPSGIVTGVQKITDIQDLDGSAIGPDNTLYVSVTDSSGAPQLLAVDPVSAAVKTQAALHVAKDIHFAAGSIWISGESADSSGGYCTVTRYDPQTLAKQGDYPIPCTNGGPPAITSMGDAVWFVDTTKTDPNTGTGTALSRIDPSTNALGTSVPLPQPDGCCQGSQGAIFCYCGNSDEWRLTSTDSAFVDLGNYAQIYPAGTGFWAELQDGSGNAGYIDGPGAPSTAVPLANGRLVGGNATGIYIQGEQTGQEANYPLLRQPTDGSAPVQLAIAPTYGADITLTSLDYGPEFPWFATPQGYLHLWVFKDTPDSPLALWEQWAPLP
jgi:hypothetical protein